MVDEAKQQFNVYLPAELVRQVKHASVDANESLSAFVQHALEAQLARLERKARSWSCPSATART